MKPSETAPGHAVEPTFAAPWQAHAFALTVSLAEAGVFSWSEWTQALASQTGRPEAARDGSDYYELWIAALEDLLARKHVAAPAEVSNLAAAWARAARATPHGEPIVLGNDPQGGG